MSRPSKITPPLQGLKTPKQGRLDEVPSLADEVDPGSSQRRRSATARGDAANRYAIEDYRDEEDDREEMDEEDYLEAF